MSRRREAVRKRATAQQREELARAVATGRQNGVAWKTLERVYGRSRAQLWRYLRAETAAEGAL